MRRIKGDDDAVGGKLNEFLAAVFAKADDEEIPIPRAFFTGNHGTALTEQEVSEEEIMEQLK